MNKLYVILAIAALPSLTPAHADDAVRTKAALTLDGAKTVIATVEKEAAKSNYAVAVSVVDDSGNLVMMERIGDVQPASVNFSIGKARTAAVFRRPTKAFETAIHDGRTALVALPDFTPLAGGVPIVYNGQVIGAIGLSGMNAPLDEQLAAVGATVLGGNARPQRHSL